MFGLLKKGLKKVSERFSEQAEELSEEESKKLEEQGRIEQPVQEEQEQRVAAQIRVPEPELAEEKREAGEFFEEKLAEPESLEVIEEKEEATPEVFETKETITKPAPVIDEARDDDSSAEIDSIAQELQKKTEEPSEPEPQEEKQPEKKKFLGIFGRKKEAIEEEKKGFAGITQKFTTVKISPEKFDELFWDLEVMLLENNVAMEVIDKMKDNLKDALVGKPLARGRIEQLIAQTLRATVEELFDVEKLDLLSKAEEKKPFVILFAGINGSGKTTTIAKIAALFKEEGKSVVLAAADTFRAAAIQQLDEHAKNLGVRMITHDYGSDPAAVAFDAIRYAEANDVDVVLVDTAGRLHSNKNLMEEMRKIVRVSKPDLKLFIGESITGNDCIEQAKLFDEAVGIDGIILSKADVDEKGGAAISVSYVTKKPILYLGTGQGYADLQKFSSQTVVESLGLSA